MLLRILKRDILRNKSINLILCFLIILSSLLIATASEVLVETFGAMDSFFASAIPPHYMQMTTEEVNQELLEEFVSNNELVIEQQTLEMLGIDNTELYFGSVLEADVSSVMENSFVTQSPKFDFLLDENNHPVVVEDGEIAIPLYAMEKYRLEKGDTIKVKSGDFEMSFVVIGFLRDSQMNPSMVSSKRFVVSPNDYELLKENTGQIEYIVEFLLADLSKVGQFATEYQEAGLPGNLNITFAILQLMNALTEGLSAVVLTLVGLVLILVAILCLRFTIMATLEEEYREIGVMRGIGLPYNTIQRLYRIKYYVMIICSGIVGYICSFFFSGTFTKTIELYMGRANKVGVFQIIPFVAVSFVALIAITYTNIVLRRMRKVSVVTAIRMGSVSKKETARFLSIGKGKFINTNIQLGINNVLSRINAFLILPIVFILACFLIVVPFNLLNTIKSPTFVKYSGSGYSDIRIDLRYSETIEGRYQQLLESLADNPDVITYAGTITANYKVNNPDGVWENIQISNGNHSIFPLEYSAGSSPTSEAEIALSLLQAQSLDKKVGDKINVIVVGENKELIVCGIYQDLTNGGKTAKGMLPFETSSVLWYTVNLNLSESANADEFINKYSIEFSPAKVIGVDEYLDQTFSSTIRQIDLVAYVSLLIAFVISALITYLFFQLLLAKENRQIKIMKSIGLSNNQIIVQYLTEAMMCLVIGIIGGILLALTLGEALVGFLFGNMGASAIRFVVNPSIVFMAFPTILTFVVLLTVYVAIRKIKMIDCYLNNE